ncbi:hypothetical protein [Pengzhenrongella phosphoraccumulans]|uniref:hypothetical protein n=1 Tax=Pengzhenrongella phosphoraccumulans TaxID=3114394 RepID=UPI00388E1A33
MIRYLLGAEEPGRRVVGRALAGLRIVAGLLWLGNVDWKRRPGVGREGERFLYGYV